MRGFVSFVLMLLVLGGLHSLVDRFLLRQTRQTFATIQKDVTPRIVSDKTNNQTNNDLQLLPSFNVSTALCPELLRAAQYMIHHHSSQSQPPLSVTLLQLVGTWNDLEAIQTMQTVFDHNAAMAARHGFRAHAITNQNNKNNLTRHPAFTKMTAIREYCLTNTKTDLVWFLDGDVVIMNPWVRIDILWQYYQYNNNKNNNTLDMLFATDFRGLNSGAFVVNCRSDTAMRLLDYWDLYATRVNAWKRVWNAMLEQNAIQWLLQTPEWKSMYPRHKRTDKLMKSSSPHERFLFSVPQLNQRVSVCRTSCEMAVFDVTFWCDAKLKPWFYETHGTMWWEDGHFMVHTAGTRNGYLRWPYLRARVQQAKLTASTITTTTSMGNWNLTSTAREFLMRYGSVQTTHPLQRLNVPKCKQEQRKADREVRSTPLTTTNHSSSNNYNASTTAIYSLRASSRLSTFLGICPSCNTHTSIYTYSHQVQAVRVPPLTRSARTLLMTSAKIPFPRSTRPGCAGI
jgi:hypothetical protein